MEEFLDYVLRRLIDHPEDLIITRHEEGGKIIFRLQLRQSDIGKIVGKGGHTIDALRNLLSAAGAKHGQRVAIEIDEDEAAA